LFTTTYPKEYYQKEVVMDWKKNVDDYKESLRERLIETQRKLDEVQSKQQQEEFNRKLRILQSKFQCVVCGKLPTGPMPGYEFGSDQGWNTKTGVPEDWNIPNNLKKCTMGNHYACEDHIYNDVCQKCGEKL
jgi:hypothetical protein